MLLFITILLSGDEMNQNETTCCACECECITAESPKKPAVPVKRYEPHILTDPSKPYFFHLCNTAIMPHWHENIEILYFHGDASVICDREEYAVTDRDIAVIGSNALHASPRCGDTVHDCLIIDSDFLSRNGIDISGLKFRCVIKDENIEALFLRVCEEMSRVQNGDRFSNAAAKAAILTLAVELCRVYSLADEGGKARGGAVKRAIGYIKSHFDEPLTVDAIAGSVNVSKYYFCREFHSETGFTVVRYINNLRCREAQKLLREEKYTISEISRICGFDNVSYFSRIYKQIIGETPTKTRSDTED